MSNEMPAAESQPARTTTDLSRFVEVLQVFSVLAIPVAVLFWKDPALEALSIVAIVVAVGGFVIPFFLIRVPKPEEPVEGTFEITEDRLVTFEYIQIPPDVRIAMKKHMLNIKYDKAATMEQALYAYCGKERVWQHVPTILRHSVFVAPPELPQEDEVVNKELKRDTSARPDV